MENIISNLKNTDFLKYDMKYGASLGISISQQGITEQYKMEGPIKVI